MSPSSRSVCARAVRCEVLTARDRDKSDQPCHVYDILFNTETLRLAEKHGAHTPAPPFLASLLCALLLLAAHLLPCAAAPFKALVVQTALESLEVIPLLPSSRRCNAPGLELTRCCVRRAGERQDEAQRPEHRQVRLLDPEEHAVQRQRRAPAQAQERASCPQVLSPLLPCSCCGSACERPRSSGAQEEGCLPVRWRVVGV